MRRVRAIAVIPASSGLVRITLDGATAPTSGSTLVMVADPGARVRVDAVAPSSPPGAIGVWDVDVDGTAAAAVSVGCDLVLVDTRALRAAMHAYVEIHRHDPYPGQVSLVGVDEMLAVAARDHGGTRLESLVRETVERARAAGPHGSGGILTQTLHLLEIGIDGYAAQSLDDPPSPAWDLVDLMRTDDPDQVAARLRLSDGASIDMLLVRGEGRGVELWNFEPSDALDRDVCASITEARAVFNEASRFLTAAADDEPWTRRSAPPGWVPSPAVVSWHVRP